MQEEYKTDILKSRSHIECAKESEPKLLFFEFSSTIIEQYSLDNWQNVAVKITIQELQLISINISEHAGQKQVNELIVDSIPTKANK